MLPTYLILTTLAYFGLVYGALQFIFRDGAIDIRMSKKDKDNSKRRKLWIGLTIVVVGYAVKLGYEYQYANQNYYQLLETPRKSTALEIRKAYKQVSKKYHPDKNSAFDAEAKFQSMKRAYDVLLDETQRQVYNRFGENSIDFDPRQDELKLLTEMIVVYLGWGVLCFTFTAPASSRSCRTWVAIFALMVLALEITFAITESELPHDSGVFPTYMTEHEVILLCHSIFPLIVAILRCLADMIYVDVDKTSLVVLENVLHEQKQLDLLLRQLRDTVHQADGNLLQEIERLDLNLQEIQNHFEPTSESTSKLIEELRTSSSSLGANYYWIVFIVLYGGVYLLQ